MLFLPHSISGQSRKADMLNHISCSCKFLEDEASIERRAALSLNEKDRSLERSVSSLCSERQLMVSLCCPPSPHLCPSAHVRLSDIPHPCHCSSLLVCFYDLYKCVPLTFSTVFSPWDLPLTQIQTEWPFKSSLMRTLPWPVSSPQMSSFPCFNYRH